MNAKRLHSRLFLTTNQPPNPQKVIGSRLSAMVDHFPSLIDRKNMGHLLDPLVNRYSVTIDRCNVASPPFLNGRPLNYAVDRYNATC